MDDFPLDCAEVGWHNGFGEGCEMEKAQKDVVVVLVSSRGFVEELSRLAARLRSDNPDATIDEFNGPLAAMFGAGIARYRLMVMIEGYVFIHSPLSTLVSAFERGDSKLDDAFSWRITDADPAGRGDPVRVFGSGQEESLVAAVNGRLAELIGTR